MCLLTLHNDASYTISVRQYRILPCRFLQCIPHGKPPCDVLTVRDVTPACKGFAPSGNYFFSSNIVNLYAKICTFRIFTDLRWWVSCSCRAHTAVWRNGGVACLNSSVVFQINFSAGLTVLCPEIPHERQAQKRWQKFKINYISKN